MEAVIFDFGGVLGLAQDPVRVATMATLCGLPLEEFLRVYQQDRLELDRGTLSVDEYWGRILAAGGRTPSARLVAQIEREDALGWTRVNGAVVAWASELRAAGYRTAILSNMPTAKLSFMRATRGFDWIDDFRPAVFSCEYRLVKPEQAIYRLCLEKLGIDAARCVFLDDSPVNVEAARACGIDAVVFRSARDATGVARERWGLPVAALEKGDGDG